jgi:hypothetical protein
MSLLTSALVVRADRFKSSIEVIRAGESSDSSTVPAVEPLTLEGVNGALASTLVLPANAVYWFTKIAAASSNASLGVIDPSVSKVISSLSRSVTCPTRVFSTLYLTR